ncbi:MAG: hypothetical protein LC792_17595 [Actinobacteria bacterium]|nr:hypothetical protein [Actinomycetota bacterium]
MVTAGSAVGAPLARASVVMPQPAGPAVNLGMATWGGGVALDSGRFAFFGVEADQGRDLNGDGDTADSVVQVWDPVTGQTVNTGLPSGLLFPLSGGRLALDAYEWAQGNKDLNGDGDTTDAITEIWDPATGTATNLGVDVINVVPLAGGQVALAASEANSGHRDLTGDGDTDDYAVLVWDPVQGLVNLHASVVVDTLKALDGGGVAYLASESGQHQNLNGDGTRGDRVATVWTPSGGVHNLGVAAGTILTPLSGGGLGFLAVEANEGHDLNGDGDTADKVVHVYQPGVGVTNLGLAGSTQSFVHYSALPGGGIAFLVVEADQGGKDLNGDGDTADTVVHVWRPGAGVLNLKVAAHFPGALLQGLDGGRLGITVFEKDQEQDLNGDGDTTDRVVELWSPAGGLDNLGLATAGDIVAVPGGGLAFRVIESDQDHTDLNGDGDTTDAVLFVALADGTVRNSRVAVAGFNPTEDGRVTYTAWEDFQGDLNHDGDLTDRVPGVYDPVTDTVVSSGLPNLDTALASLGGDRYGFAVMESSQNQTSAAGTDLNGDGDTSDYVMHVITMLTRPVPPVVEPPDPGTGTGTGSGGDQPDPGTPAPTATPGYWMVGSDGAVYGFGAAHQYGNAPTKTAVDLEPTPSGKGYWVVDETGRVWPFGDAADHGSVDRTRLAANEKVTSLSATPSGTGYWIFTSRGRVLPFGDAPFLGDVGALTLAGPVLDSIPTPSGRGYYLVGSDGGIFAFGDARFFGSMGGRKLNAPVQSLVPDPDGTGYWLVAADGGIFAFDADFHGSMGGTRLNKPVTGMVRAGHGYLMVGEDGGIFDFSNTPDGFQGSLGGHPPTKPIVSVAVVP